MIARYSKASQRVPRAYAHRVGPLDPLAIHLELSKRLDNFAIDPKSVQLDTF
jgi:hypothetical protein